MPKRIGVISERASPLGALGGTDAGGQNAYVSNIAAQLAKMGYEVDVFTRKDDLNLPAVVEVAPRFRVIHVAAGPAAHVAREELLPYMDEFTTRVRRFIDGNLGYDLLHANFYLSGQVAAQLKQALGTRFVVTFHALGRVRLLHHGEDDRFPPERSAIEARVMAEADRIIAACPQEEADLVQYYQADAAKIRLVPCGYDEGEFWQINKAAARRALGFDPAERIVLYVGRLTPRKGIDAVIAGFSRLVHRHELPARLVIVGGDSERPDAALTPEIGRLQDVAQRENVADRVTFTGRRGRGILRYYYSAADVFTTMPWYAPFGIPAVEAMACGTPVVAAAVGGLKYTVRDGETGYLIPPKDAVALGSRLAQLFKRPHLLAELSHNARARVRQHFTWQRVAAELAEVYEEVWAKSEFEPLLDGVPALTAADVNGEEMTR